MIGEKLKMRAALGRAGECLIFMLVLCLGEEEVTLGRACVDRNRVPPLFVCSLGSRLRASHWPAVVAEGFLLTEGAAEWTVSNDVSPVVVCVSLSTVAP